MSRLVSRPAQSRRRNDSRRKASHRSTVPRESGFARLPGRFLASSAGPTPTCGSNARRGEY